MEQQTPSSKIIVGIPTFGRTWKLTTDDSKTGVPPLVADGPGAEGPQTATPGLLSYAEICPRLIKNSPHALKVVNDRTKRYGKYAYKLYNADTNTDGLWVGFESPDTAANKAQFVKRKGLGGIAIWDLSTDDYRGVCTGQKFPILEAAQNKLRN